MNTLERLAIKYGSDKCPEIAHSFTDFYNYMFAKKRNSIRKLLEIGVGSSLYMWQDYFPKAKIYGIDIDKSLVFKKNRVQTFLCDQADPIKLKKLIKKIGNDIDIVIDDGSPDPQDKIASCQTLMPLLKKGVTYVIEDTNRSQAGLITENLKNYDYHVMRRSRMKTSDDRLIVITNKNG